ncbi:extracellular solute-binding protein [Neoehrlichia mikurensis]|uniref:Extracellular solute-binding protein n=1 Tax=Neoehrlichia mikurensis TaxID=89586 RepID=A0A9Q9BTN7_9RICK|nr:extracellular solute-binding protein [Neoehrlichia mikurensis]QXK92214.1 extracellular solute-binding protein [Neoehrlichia mikurensis]QXK92670.1 extracellular solute-binding protein [Neoehrlichia mikurensis]QXK93907.1 extracellular solute-binding protein [Neoehrlichia mikurensis]UTO55091.1 extracellular solute-binding protein [Neoehrlichia mikurensis]UTO56010.1 extracellular solute-binding protein [Neoehrlichia mikurensis]
MSRTFSLLFFVLIVSTVVVFLYKNYHSDNKNVVNVFSSRKEELLRDVFQRFTEKTGIKVRYINDDAAQLISRMESEGSYGNGDVFLTADAVNLILAKKKGLLQEVNSKILNEAIPQKYRDAKGYWFGLTKRARIIVYNKELVSSKELSTYEDLANVKWKDKILVRSSNSPYNQSLIAFMIANNGEKNTRAWVRGLVNNMARKPSGGDTDQIYAVAAGEGSIAIVNSYYFGRILMSQKEKDKQFAKKLSIFFPNQNTTGVMINISGGAVTKYAKNKEGAIKLLEFLISTEAQKIYSEANQEYPIIDIGYSDILKSWGTFKESDLPLQELENYLKQSVKIADEEGWK